MSNHTGPAATPGIDYTLVIYDDGSEAVAPARVGDLVAFENEKGRPPSTTSIADVLWLIHRSLKVVDDFQTWADRVAAVESDADIVAAARERLGSVPTPAAAGAE